jgi:hypothetical protein
VGLMVASRFIVMLAVIVLAVVLLRLAALASAVIPARAVPAGTTMVGLAGLLAAGVGSRRALVAGRRLPGIPLDSWLPSLLDRGRGLLSGLGRLLDRLLGGGAGLGGACWPAGTPGGACRRGSGCGPRRVRRG